jgi:pyridoxamine 5'-phosphate oxidase
MTEPINIAALRANYSRLALSEEASAADPFTQFAAWFKEALAARVPEPNACTLATAGADGRPSARVVLLKGFDPAGFVFFTNFHSRKGRDLAANPYACLVFWWIELERQVRIAGPAKPLPDAAADAYFAERPRESQLGAWASEQSASVASREELEEQFAAAEARFDGQPVPRPPHWGGYLLAPEECEFWQGRPGRLHDRLLYHRAGETWTRTRLAP